MASMMTCRIHPVVLLSIVDAHERRAIKEKKAVGTLLGSYDQRVVEVTNSYSVPFSEAKGEPEIDTSYNSDMFDLFRKTASEFPVGWFCTSPEVTEHCISYHDYYSDFSKFRQGKREQVPTILVTVDASLRSNKMEIKAYLRVKAGIPGGKEAHCAIFLPLKVELAMYDTEETSLDLITQGTQNTTRQANLASGMGQMFQYTEKMLQWIEEIRQYVDDVIAGKEKGDSQMGRQLMELVTSTGKVQPKQFENMINSSVKDFLMVYYLSQLAKTQLTLHEKMLKV